LGWKAFERGEYEKCLEYSNKALELDNSFSYIHFNIGLVYLIEGKSKDALDRYINAISINNKNINPKSVLEGAIGDLNKYFEIFPDKKTASDIKELLEEDLKNK
jgi:tetratricopeptide (TPR) repeat protein